MRFCAHTPCFRREAGAAGIGTRGITRVHQFEKVEMVWITKPEDSNAALETMRGHAEALLTSLGLKYRILDLCTGDIGSALLAPMILRCGARVPIAGLKSQVSAPALISRHAAWACAIVPGLKLNHRWHIPSMVLAWPASLLNCRVETYQQADGSIQCPLCYSHTWVVRPCLKQIRCKRSRYQIEGRGIWC